MGTFGRCLVILLAAGFGSWSMVGSASALDRPTGRVLLTVDGAIAVSNDGTGGARFDKAMLEALGVVAILTETPWTDGLSRFEGVPLAALMRVVGARGDRIRAMAINDYAVEIPLSDATAHDPIIALKLNGDYMSVREKGPLWIIYPWSDKPALRNETYYARGIWQLKRLTVR